MQNSASISFLQGIRSRSRSELSRRELFLWMVVALLANHALHTIDTQSFKALLQSLASQNLIYWFSCYVIVRGLLDSDPEPLAIQRDLWVAIAGGLALFLSSFVGYRFAIGLLTTFVAFYILLNGSKDGALKSVGTVLLALSIHLIWAPMIFRIVTPELLAADAAAVHLFLSVFRPDITMVGTTFYGANNHVITLVGGCSSFQNVSIAMLASVSVTMLVRPYWVRNDIYWILAICTTMIVINVIRLGILAWSFGVYDFWHNGAGVSIIALTQTVIIAIMSYLGAQAGKRKTGMHITGMHIN